MGTALRPSDLGAGRPHRLGQRRVWLKRGLIGVVFVVLGACAIGAVYQSAATTRDRSMFTAPGQLVDIGGRRIHLLVMGQDTARPTVILESGMATFSANYYWVQNELAGATRVVAYDRAGLGWSDPAPAPQDAQQSARDLHAALLAGGISGPFVVAGHSYGGLVVRAFTDLYPNEVVGMVLIDASHPDQWVHIPISREGRFNGRANLFTGFLARLGLVRLLRLERAIYAGLPEQPAAEIEAILARPETWQTSGEVLLLWHERTRPQINGARSLGNLPLAVVSVSEQPVFGDVLTRLQDELPTLSGNSVHYTEVGATHENLVAGSEHAHVVVRTILQVLESARTGRPLSEITAVRE